MPKVKTAKTEDGSYKYKTKCFMFNGKKYRCRGKTQREADEKAAAKLENLRQYYSPNSLINAEISVKEYSEIWLREYVLPKVREPGKGKERNTMSQKSFAMYTQKLNNHIIPEIGNFRMGDIKDTHLQRILNKQTSSESHAKKVKIVLNAMFTQAMKSHVIPNNPADNLTIPAAAEKGAHRSLTDYEREILLDVAKTHRCGLWIRFLLATGVRPGESAPLRVMDINRANDTIRIFRAIESGTERVIGETKTKAGIRSVPITADIRDDLYKSIDGKKPTDYIFTESDGVSMLTTSAMSQNWIVFSRQMDIRMGAEMNTRGHIYDPKDIDENGIPLYPDENGMPRNGHRIAPDLVLYCLRHTYCTDLEKAGIPLNIAKTLMGHSDISVTASIYTHTDIDEVITAGDMINAYMSGKKPKQLIKVS